MMYDTATPYLASFIIVKKDNKIAFVLRSNTKWMNGYYGLPSGKVEKNESFTQAAIREAKEEIGITLSEDQVKFLHTMHRRGDDSDWVDIYYEAKHYIGEPYNAEPSMHGKIAWFGLNELPDNVVPPVKYALEQIESGQVYSEYGWS